MRLHPLSWLATATWVATGAGALLLAACEESPVCKKADGVMVCGEFGAASYVAQLGTQVQWPPIAVENGRILLARGQQLVSVDAQGKVVTLANTGDALTIPSSDTDGSLYVQGGTNAGTSVRAFASTAAISQSASDQGARWLRSLPGRPTGTPPTLGKGVLHAATVEGGTLFSPGTQTTLFTLDSQTGDVIRSRKGASPAAVLADGSLRFLTHPVGLTASGNTEDVAGNSGGAIEYGQLVAEDAAGNVIWTLEDKDGLVDFAPGPSGETYVVTSESHLLRRVSAAGAIEWSFDPPCANCTVAAAPTVEKDVVYFPVWETRNEELIDPLFALDAKTGATRWVYDGFSTRRSTYNPFSAIGGGDGVTQTKVKHHPAGRPVVAQDGTLYVSTDGAVSALDAQGQMLGVAMYDSDVGEVSTPGQSGTWINPGVRPSPVLGPDGMLYVWDGAAVRAFKTNRPASTAAWVAPFGGPTNAGRAPQ